MNDIAALFHAPTEGTRINPNITFRGSMEITGPESVLISGVFEGEIIAKEGTVFIGADGVLRGTVKAAQVIVAGTVEALTETDHIEATKILGISGTGSLSSHEINYGSIAMEMGSVVHGGMRPLAPRKAMSNPSMLGSLNATSTGQAPESRVVNFERSTAIPPAFLKQTPAISADASTDIDEAPAKVARTGTHDSSLDPIIG